MTKEVPVDCLCFGIVVADHVCEPISSVPHAGDLVLTPRTHLSIGGCAANVAVDLVRLGRTAAVVGRVGDDAFGRFAIDALSTAGVDVRHIASLPGEATSTSMIINVRGKIVASFTLGGPMHGLRATRFPPSCSSNPAPSTWGGMR